MAKRGPKAGRRRREPMPGGDYLHLRVLIPRRLRELLDARADALGVSLSRVVTPMIDEQFSRGAEASI